MAPSLAQGALGTDTMITPPLIIPGSTVIPTDTIPVPYSERRTPYAEKLQFKILQKLPSEFYLLGTVENSFRLETNPFQTATRRQVQNHLAPNGLAGLSPAEEAAALQVINLCDRSQQIFRTAPNIVAGYAITPKTRIYSNYFLIRDSLFHGVHLSTNVQSLSGGIQHDFVINKRTILQADFQARELFQTNQVNLFDFLPGATLSYSVNPRTTVYANTILQLRGKQPFVAPTAEIDPFYTVGGFYQRNGWQFTAGGTFLQNFRQLFGTNAIIGHSNYAFVLDFEIARRLSKKMPGLVAFVRAEPIFNFHSNAQTGISGTDFRLFYGLRLAFSKVALTGPMKEFEEELKRSSSSETGQQTQNGASSTTSTSPVAQPIPVPPSASTTPNASANPDMTAPAESPSAPISPDAPPLK